MVVKGSEQYRTIVVPYRPLRRLVLTVVVLAIAAAAILVSYQYGYREAQANYQDVMAEWAQLHELADRQSQQLQQLNQQVTNTQLSSSIDQHAMEALRQQIVVLSDQVTSLQESNNFYRQLMDEPEKNKGLVVASFKVKALNQPRHYQYELVMQLITTDHRVSTGKVNINVAGILAETPRVYSVVELSDKPTKADIPLKLRFYQTITGTLVLPEGFEAKRVEITAEKSGAAAVTAGFDWVVTQ